MPAPDFASTKPTMRRAIGRILGVWAEFRHHRRRSALLLAARPPGAPAAEFADLSGVRDGIGFAQKAGHRAAVFESDRAEAERRHHICEESTDSGDRHIPYLGLDRGARSGIPDQTRPLAVGERVEPV